jgi:hypothetical protein
VESHAKTSYARKLLCFAFVSSATLFGGFPKTAIADEGGVSFWVPGLFGSLAAVPQNPGFGFANIYYHSSVTASGDVAFARQVARGRLTTNFSGNLNADLNADVDFYFAAPSYVFSTPLFGAQAAVSLLIPYGQSRASVDATLTSALGPFGFNVGGSTADTVTGVGDIAPQFALRWNFGVNNFMTYVAGDIPVGRYDTERLANLGLGHSAIDVGGGYTYFNPQTGWEFSSVLGVTYNFENEHTDYQNGVDMHLDLSASRFVTKELQLGVVGYAFRQVSCDSGAGNRVGCFESQVFGVGPQIGYIIPMGDLQGYLNIKAYREFAAEHRAEGWNTWVALGISEKPPPAPTSRPQITK